MVVLSSGDLKVAAHLDVALVQAWSNEFRSNRIVLITDLALCDECDVALIEIGAEPEFSQLVAVYRSRQVPVVYVVPGSHPDPLGLLAAGADGLVGAAGNGNEAAWCLWSIARQAEFRRTLEQRIVLLERQIQRDKLIGQAKAIVAQNLRISEAAALKHLRSESRRRRRSMEELAKVIIDAQRLAPPAPGGEEEGSAAT